MREVLQKAVELLRRTSRGHFTLSVILAVVADLLVRSFVPGTSILEIILGVLTGLIVMFMAMQPENKPVSVTGVHDAFQG